MGVEILPLLPALISCLIVGLDDINEESAKNVEILLMTIEKTFSTRFFYTYFWLSILRTPKTRGPGMKFLRKNIPFNLENAKASDVSVTNYEYFSGNHEIENKPLTVSTLGEKRTITVEELLYHYYPRKSSLVLLSIVNCIIKRLRR